MANPFSEKELLFSIITPCYGDDWAHLEKNASTLNEQEYKNFEWIVVFQKPDKKHAKGIKVLEQMKEKYKFPITYYVIEEKGACLARNYGATKAKGDIYCFLNADNYYYPEALRVFATEFENPEVNRVWGSYDLITQEGIKGSIVSVPLYPDGRVWYKAFKYTNYCDSSFPIRATSYIDWDPTVKSLQDWDWAIRQLQRDNFEGKDWRFINHAFFAAEDAEPGGLSDDSHRNWIERTDYIRNKNGLPKSDICVTSLGAAHHGFHIAEKLGADYLPMPSFKDHKYKMIYLIGFFTQEDPNQPIVTQLHLQVFANTKAKKVIHWIGSDILQLHWNNSFEKLKSLRKWFKDNKVVHLCEAEHTQKELAEVGIKATVVPIPPRKLNEPIELPKEFTVAIYESNKTNMYNRELMESVVRSMPDVKFYFFGENDRKGLIGANYEHLGFINVDEWMPKFSLNLRVTVHDGLPLLPLEFMTAGRQVICNIPMKGAIKVDTNRKQIVDAVRKCKETTLDGNIPNYWKKELATNKYITSIRSYL